MQHIISGLGSPGQKELAISSVFSFLVYKAPFSLLYKQQCSAWRLTGAGTNHQHSRQQPRSPQLLRAARPVHNCCTLSSQETFDLEFNFTIYIYQLSCITHLFRTFSFQRACQKRHHQRQPGTHHAALESSRADTN